MLEECSASLIKGPVEKHDWVAQRPVDQTCEQGRHLAPLNRVAFHDANEQFEIPRTPTPA